MAGAGVPVSMDDGTGIAAAPAIVCPLPGVARSGEKWPKVFLGVLPRPELSKLGGVRNAVRRKNEHDTENKAGLGTTARGTGAAPLSHGKAGHACCSRWAQTSPVLELEGHVIPRCACELEHVKPVDQRSAIR